MIYVIDGKEEYFIKEKINEIIKDKNAEIVKFDGSDKNFSIDEMLEACESNSLFSNETVVLVNQPYFLNKKIEDKELERLYQYIDNPIYETDLIFYTYEDNFNSKLKAYKTILGNAQHIKLDGLDYKNFNKLTDKVVDYYSKYEVSGINVDGELTLGENIADLGAVGCISGIAKEKGATNSDMKKMYKGFAKTFISKVNPQMEKMLMAMDVHSPNKVRVNATLSSTGEFYDTYNIKKSSDMYIDSKNRVRVW